MSSLHPNPASQTKRLGAIRADNLLSITGSDSLNTIDWVSLDLFQLIDCKQIIVNPY